MLRICCVAIFLLMVLTLGVTNTHANDAFPNARKPTSREDLKYWLENMVVFHDFTVDEIQQATGLEQSDIQIAIKGLKLKPGSNSNTKPNAPLLIKPYPGGRHPRIGFLEGAIHPQRETKISVFTPWDQSSYVVLDIPEAIWSNLGLTYLAHTHVPTIWSKQNIELPQMEWTRHKSGMLSLLRKLPNGIQFHTVVVPRKDAVLMDMLLTNGTDKPLSKLHVQNCAMLKMAKGFSQQNNANKVFRAPYAACKSESGNHWIIMAWSPCFKTWGNQKCPCLHSDPIFPDCPPGETTHIKGWFSFFTGTNIEAEFDRIDQLGWQKIPMKGVE
ncbi:hypothetical protein [uncultured Gimesia sp.]|uniref:hypothetical protein n=1 Tax=uncultured Gimesia sp. TaxID=1678688 RepID=UPI00262E8815|nr:hypothetical protein [uncultured Gimesia sp.]